MTTTSDVEVAGMPTTNTKRASTRNATAFGVRSKRSIRGVMIVLAASALLAIGATTAIVTTSLLSSSSDSACPNEVDARPPSTAEVDVLVDLDANSYGFEQPVPHHTFAEAVQTPIGQNVTLNVIGTGGNLSKPSLLEAATLTVKERNVLKPVLHRDGRRLSVASSEVSDFKFAELLQADETGIVLFRSSRPMQFANISSATCLVNSDGILSHCEAHRADEDTAKIVERRRQLLIAVAAAAAFTAEVVVEVVFDAVVETAVVAFVTFLASFSCFPGSAQVQTPTGVKAIKDLQISDRVLTQDGFSPVYLFGHYDPTAVSTMTHLWTANGHELSLSHDHYVPFTNGSHAMAKNVKVGDSVWALDAHGRLIESRVAKVSLRMETGLFNPYSHSGTLVVNNVLASAHSSWLFEGLLPETHLPTVYDALLKPVRGLHLLFPEWLARFSDKTAGEGALNEKGVLGIMHAAVSTALSA